MTSQSLIAGSDAGRDDPRWSDTLPDGTPVVVRPITPEDGPAERELIEGLSDESRHYRFLGGIHYASDALVRQLTQLDYVHDVAFAAVVQDGSRQRIVGVSRYSTYEQGNACECAVTVADSWHNLGIGTLLMEHLIEVARARGIRRMVSIDDADNRSMQELAADLGFTTRVDPDDPAQVFHELELA